MTKPVSSVPEIDERYLLRDLVWCGLCDVPLKPARLPWAAQRQALEMTLERVTVGRDLGDLRYQWRDQP